MCLSSLSLHLPYACACSGSCFVELGQANLRYGHIVSLAMNYEAFYGMAFNGMLSILFVTFFASLVNTLNVRLCTVGVAHSALEVLRSVIKSRRWAGHVARMGERKVAYRVLVGKPEGKGPPWTHRHRWDCKIKMDLQEVGCGGMEWIHLAQHRERWRGVVKAVMNLRVT